MAILTKFLQLLKPERNDYVDVEKHLSENYDKIDTKMEELSNSNDEKLNKGAVSSEYDTAKKIEDKIKGIDEKFKNFCPFPVNSLYLSLENTNPSSLWLGTTWQKQENRFLLGAGSNYNLGATGGNSTVTLSIGNLPSHNHSASTSSHNHSQPAHTHTFQGRSDATEGSISGITQPGGGDPKYGYLFTVTTTANGGDTTGSASPTTSIGYTGSGSAFSIMPPYLVVNIWKRTS